MAMVKQSSSRYEQKRISRLELGIRAAQQSGISSDQAQQAVIRIYGEKKQDTEEGHVTRLDVAKWDGEVYDQEQEAVKVHKHVILPIVTYQRFEGKRSQRLSGAVTKMFLDHPERLEQYNILRDHRFSRLIAIDIITKSYSENGHTKDGSEETSLKETHTLDLAAPAWQKLIGEHKALFTNTYDRRINDGHSHIEAINSIFKEMDQEYKATKGRCVFDQINEIMEQRYLASKNSPAHASKAKEWKPDLHSRYFKHFNQVR